MKIRLQTFLSSASLAHMKVVIQITFKEYFIIQF